MVVVGTVALGLTSAVAVALNTALAGRGEGEGKADAVPCRLHGRPKFPRSVAVSWGS